MNKITFIVLNNYIKQNIPNADFIEYNSKTILNDLKNINSKYICFIKDLNNILSNYFTNILDKINEDFDSCFLNYTITIDGEILSREQIETPEINVKPYLKDFIWSFIFSKEKLISLLDNISPSNELIDELFKKTVSIPEVIYNHKPSQSIITNLPYVDEKEIIREKNIFYMGTFCNGLFNGYITWLNNIGRCFGADYQITILYDKITDITKKRFAKYFKVIQREQNKIYLTNRLFVTYSTYYYPKNILFTDENYLFIHGNMNDYERARKFKYDNYTKYIAVSAYSAKKAEGYFPTNQISYILNPIKIDSNDIKPHMKLVSALRNDNIKRLDRIHKISTILDEEKIPYTWNVFIDVKPYEHEIYGGVMYRNPVANPLPFINDADYFVQLSDSEACSYSVLEALSLNTKVILTPIPSYKELNIDKDQGTYIPFELFEDDKKEELRVIVKKIYQNVNKPIQNKLSPSMYEGYHELLQK